MTPAFGFSVGDFAGGFVPLKNGNSLNGSGSTDLSTTGITINNTGGGVAHNVMQPSVVINFIIKYYGITQDPETKEYMLIMEYADGGNLHNYLQKNFTAIKWNTKLAILIQISDGYLHFYLIITFINHRFTILNKLFFF